jgi:hypothetical protein
MMARLKRNGPRAAGTARRAVNVPCGKRTAPNNATRPFDAIAFARAWVARRYRLQASCAGIIASTASLGGRP